MARRPSRVMCGTGNTRVNRTPSGLPLCSTCHIELGFCSHGGASIDQAEGTTAVPAAAAAAAAGSGTMKNVSTRQSRERAALADYLHQGTKRRRSEMSLGKGKRRGVFAQPKVKAHEIILIV